MSQSSRARTLLAVVGASVGALALAGVGLLWADREVVGDSLDIVEEELATREDVIDQLIANDKEIRRQLEDNGIQPTAPPASEVVENLPEVPRPDAAPVPLTDEQVEAAVVIVLEENPDMITSQVVAEVSRYLIANPPPPGEPGADATPEMAFEAAVAFCSGPDEPCRGEAGQDGQDGTDAVLTQEMVEAALADLCSTNPEVCDSEVPGPVGDTGRGLVGLECVDGVLVATYDKEPFTQVIAGTVCQFPPGQGGKD